MNDIQYGFALEVARLETGVRAGLWYDDRCMIERCLRTDNRFPPR